MQYGRKVLYTDVKEITRDNIIKVLRQAMLDFLPNADDCTFLLNYEKGIQTVEREKTYRPDINNVCIDNVANEITNFKTSFNWGNAITLIQRGETDSGKGGESDAISLLNECYEAENIKKKSQELARFVEICGIGYTYVAMNTDYEEGDSYFKIDVLDPRYAFVVRSSRYADHRVMFGVTFRKDINGNYYFTCFTKEERFEIINLLKIVNEKTKRENKVDKWEHEERSGEKNPLGIIPINEWIRDFDRMGCFERQISEMNNLNLLISDFTDDVDQNTQAIWHGNDVEFPKEIIKDENGNTKEVEKHPKTNDWMITQTTQDGKTPFVKPLAIEYDYQGMLNNIVTRRALILQKCNVPQRNDNSGGSTGVAMDSATGWTAAETEANMQDQIKYGCKMDEVKIVLAAIRECPDTPPDSPLLTLRYCDVKAITNRNKNYELSVKSSALKNLITSGVYGLHAFEVTNIFSDTNQAWADSKSLVEQFQKSLFSKETTSKEDKAETTDGGMEAQVSNSPLIDGISTNG